MEELEKIALRTYLLSVFVVVGARILGCTSWSWWLVGIFATPAVFYFLSWAVLIWLMRR